MFFCCLFLGTVKKAPKHVFEGISGIQKHGEIKGPTMVGIDRGSGNFDVRYVLWKVDDLDSDGIKRQCKSNSCISSLVSNNSELKQKMAPFWGPTSAACWWMSGLHLMMLGQLPYKSVSFPSSEAFRVSVKMHGFGLAVLDPKIRGNKRSRV